jgi:putative DNA primase/helicase
MNAAAIAEHLAGKPARRLVDGSYLVPCPVPSHGKRRGDRNPSLQISDGEGALLVTCHAGCDRLDVIAVLRRRGLLGGVAAAPPSASNRTAELKGRRGADDQQVWRPIWKAAQHPLGTPVDLYIARRHLILPSDPGDCLRFHPHCPFGKNDDGRTICTPCMVALVRNIITNKPQAIHRTALDQDGRKVTVGGYDRMALGRIGGGAVKLTADENVTIAIGIGEGIESALSLQRTPEWAGSPVWSLLNDSGVANFPMLDAIETLVVAVDHDDAGEKAARAVAERWCAAARQVLLFEPVAPGDDMNDVIADE